MTAEEMLGRFARLTRGVNHQGGVLRAGTIVRVVAKSGRQLVVQRPREDCTFEVRSRYSVRLIDERHCRKCGCTDHDCRDCAAATGKPCVWVEADLCSACVEGRHDA